MPVEVAMDLILWPFYPVTIRIWESDLFEYKHIWSQFTQLMKLRLAFGLDIVDISDTAQEKNWPFTEQLVLVVFFG